MGKKNSNQDKFLPLIRAWIATSSNAAWEGLWLELYPYLIQCASTILQDEADQVDVASDSFVKIMTNLSNYDPKMSKFTTWCWRICTNACHDRFRRCHHSQLDPAHAELLPIDADHGETEDLATVSSYLVFRIPSEALADIMQVWWAHHAIPTPEAAAAVQAILDIHDVAWDRYGSIESLTAFLFALVRFSKLTAKDRVAAIKAIDAASPMSPAGFLMPFIGRDAVSLLVLLFGGTPLTLPTVAELQPRRRSKR